jgi:hypothetical protein
MLLAVAWTLIAGIVVVLVLPIAFRAVARRFDPFEPLVLFAAAYGVMFALRPATMIVSGEYGFWGVDVRETLPLVLLLALTGAVAFVCAYESRAGVTVGRWLPAPPPLAPRRAAIACLAMALIAVGSLAALVATSDSPDALGVVLRGRSGQLNDLLRENSSYLWYGSTLVAPASVLLVALALRRRSLWLAAAATFVLALAFVRTVPIGSRIVLLPMLGGIFAVVYLVRDRRPGLWALAAVTAVAIFASYVISHARQQEDRAKAPSAVEVLVRSPGTMLDPILHGPDAEMAPALGAALTVVPDELHHRWGGATLGDLVTRPVPRQLWDGKPRPPGEELVAKVWPSLYPNLNPAFSPLLPFYWDLGIAGVLLGMALFGIAARTLYAWFSAHRHNETAQVTFAVATWFAVIGARDNPVDTIMLASFLVLPILAIAAVSADRSAAAERTRTAVARMRPTDDLA